MTARMRKWILLAFVFGFISGGVMLFFMMPALVPNTPSAAQSVEAPLEGGELSENAEEQLSPELEALPEEEQPSELPRDAEPTDEPTDMPSGDNETH